MAVSNLLFIDTNIWLDFYRHRNNTGLRLLEHTEAIKDKLIVTYQLENEFKANRQAAILEGHNALQAFQGVSRPGIFSEAKATEMISKHVKEGNNRIQNLRSRMVRALKNPTAHDPVYKVCQRVFHKGDALTLNPDNKLRHTIRRRAFERFLQGWPPRKKNDTSIGDAFNWEWMVYCAKERKTGLVIVTRDADYGVTFDNQSYINDHLRHEFSERVSQKRDLLLYASLSEALKLFSVDVSDQEQAAEKEVVKNIFAQREAEGFSLSPGVRALYGGLGLSSRMSLASLLESARTPRLDDDPEGTK